MIFTKEQIEEIRRRLALMGKKDTGFEQAKLPLDGKETMVVVQNGVNRQLPVGDFFEKAFQMVNNLGVFNVSRYVQYTNPEAPVPSNLAAAIEACPQEVRTPGQIITFYKGGDKWALFQFTSSDEGDWEDTSLWYDISNVSYTNFSFTVTPDIVEEDTSVAISFEVLEGEVAQEVKIYFENTLIGTYINVDSVNTSYTVSHGGTFKTVVNYYGKTYEFTDNVAMKYSAWFGVGSTPSDVMVMDYEVQLMDAEDESISITVDEGEEYLVLVTPAEMSRRFIISGVTEVPVVYSEEEINGVPYKVYKSVSKFGVGTYGLIISNSSKGSGIDASTLARITANETDIATLNGLVTGSQTQEGLVSKVSSLGSNVSSLMRRHDIYEVTIDDLAEDNDDLSWTAPATSATAYVRLVVNTDTMKLFLCKYSLSPSVSNVYYSSWDAYNNIPASSYLSSGNVLVYYQEDTFIHICRFHSDTNAVVPIKVVSAVEVDNFFNFNSVHSKNPVEAGVLWQQLFGTNGQFPRIYDTFDTVSTEISRVEGLIPSDTGSDNSKYYIVHDEEDFFDTIDFRVGNPGIFEIQKDYKDITVDDVRNAYNLRWKFPDEVDYKDVDEIPVGIDYKGLPHLYDDAELCAYTATISGTERHINPIDVTITDTLTTRYASNNVAVLKAFFAEIANGTIRDCLGFKLSNIYSFEFSTYPASRSEYQSNCIGIPIDFILLGKIQKDEDGNEIKRGGFIAKNALFYTEHSLYMKDFLLYKKSTDSQYTIYMCVTDQYDKNANNYEGSGFTPADTTTYPSLGTLYIDQLQVINCIFDSKKDSMIHYHENKYGWYIKIAGHNHPPIKYRDTANNPIAEVEKNNCINHIYIADSVFHGSASINYDNVRVVKSSRIINNLFDEFTSAPLSSATTNKSNNSDYLPYKRTSPVDSGNNTADDLVFPLYNLQLIKWMACPIYIVGNTFKSRHKLNYRPVKASSSRTISGVKAPYIDGYFRTRFRNMSGEFIEEFDDDNNVKYFYEDDTTSRTECIDQSPLYYTAVEAEGGSYYVCHNTIEDIIFAPCCLIDYYDGVGYYVMDAKGYNKESSSASGFLDTFFSTHDEIYDAYINSTNLVYVNNHVKNLVKLAQGRGNFGIMKSKSNAVGLVCNPGYIKQGEEPAELRLSYLHHANKCWEYNHYELDVNEIIKLYDDYLLMCEYINSVRTNITYYTPSSGYTHVSDVDDFYIGADNKEKVEKGVKIGTLKEAVLAYMRVQPNISEETIDRVNNALDLYANDWYTTYQYKYLKKTYMTYINTTVPSDKNRVLSIKFDQSQSNDSGTFENDEYRTVGSLKAPSVIENLVFSHNILDARTGIIEGHGNPNHWPCNKFEFTYNTFIANNFTGSEYKAAAGETVVKEGIICIAPYKLGLKPSSVNIVGNTINVRALLGPINLCYINSYIASSTSRPQYTHYYLNEEGVISTETAVNASRMGNTSYIKHNRIYEVVRDADGNITSKTFSTKPYLQIGTYNTSTYRYLILSNDFMQNITNSEIASLPDKEIDSFPIS